MEKALLTHEDSCEDVRDCSPRSTDECSEDTPTAVHAFCSGVSPKRALRMRAAAEAPRTVCTLDTRPQAEVSSQVLVTFRGVAVDENLVHYAQQRAVELGISRAGALHVLLSKAGAEEACTAIVRARIGARRYERCARAIDSLPAMRAAFDALNSDCTLRPVR
jgi:hypothetical protein